MRGGDPDVEMTTNDNYFKFLGNAQNALALAGNVRSIKYSSVAGVIVNYMFSNDAAFLALALHSNVIDLPALQAAFTYLTQNMNVSAMSEEEF